MENGRRVLRLFPGSPSLYDTSSRRFPALLIFLTPFSDCLPRVVYLRTLPRVGRHNCENLLISCYLCVYPSAGSGGGEGVGPLRVELADAHGCGIFGFDLGVLVFRKIAGVIVWG